MKTGGIITTCSKIKIAVPAEREVVFFFPLSSVQRRLLRRLRDDGHDAVVTETELKFQQKEKHRISSDDKGQFHSLRCSSHLITAEFISIKIFFKI